MNENGNSEPTASIVELAPADLLGSPAPDLNGGNSGSDIQPADAAPVINAEAKPVTAEQLIEKRGRGRPKGTKNKKPESNQAAPPEIPGELPGLAGGGVMDPAPEINPVAEAAGTTVAQTEIAAPSVDYQFLARLTVNMGTSSLSMIFGPEWNPEDENEATQLTNAIAAYMQAKDVQDIPPGALLAVVVMTYSAKRFRKPSTREKLKVGWYWIKTKVFRRKAKPIALAQ